MLTRKACKHCGSLWHSKAKCPDKPINPFKPTYTPLSRQKPSDTLRLAYKGTSERSQLTGWADKYHSAYIRSLSEYCYTCGAKPEELQNGHFMSRRYLNTRWDNMNCHPQCHECNSVKQGNLIVYQRKLRSEYGEEAVDDLMKRARSGNKVTNQDIQAIIDKYKPE